jgi:iron complex outermembrane receptor protein
MGALTWQPLRGFDITASVAQRTRFPTLKERFSSAFGSLEPNPSLAPERATNLSLDATLQPIRELRVDAGVFDSEVRDLVIKVPLDAQTQQWQNAGRARGYGVAVSLRARPSRWLEASGGWAALRTRRLDQDPPNDVIPYQPDQKATVAITLLPIRDLALTVVGRYVGSQSFQNLDTLQWGTLGGSRMIDARVEVVATDGLRVWLRGTNLTDANVQGQFSFPEPGRQGFVGVSFAWPEEDTTPRGAT